MCVTRCGQGMGVVGRTLRRGRRDSMLRRWSCLSTIGPMPVHLLVRILGKGGFEIYQLDSGVSPYWDTDENYHVDNGSETHGKSS